MSTVTTHALAADDFLALKLADSIAFHLYEGVYYLRAHRNPFGKYDEAGKRLPEIWSARDQRVFPELWSGADWRARTIAADGRVTDYGKTPAEVVSAYASVTSAQVNAAWGTIADLLRVGDRLSIHFTAANNNGALNDAGLFNDECELIVERGHERVRRMTFLVDHRVCPDNTARMCQVR